MFEHQLHTGTKLYKMVMENRNIKKSLLSLGGRVIEMVHHERFDPRTVEFHIMSPKGEENKIHITLLSAEYSTAPIVEAPDDIVSTAIVRSIDSLFKAMGSSSSMLGFLNVCPGLCTLLYAVCNYIHEQHYKYGRKDLRQEMVWDCYDHYKEKDLVIAGVMS